jgi:hypothetical protein
LLKSTNYQSKEYYPYFIGVDTISEGIEPHLKYNYLMLIISCLIISVPVSNASSVAPYNVEVTHDYVTATAVCSCGLNSYTYHTGTFKNYCPQCHSYGTLIFNPKGVPEGEWTCKKCNSDYCAADGMEKMPHKPIGLIPYNSPEVQAQEVMSTKVQTVITNLGRYKDKSFLGDDLD